MNQDGNRSISFSVTTWCVSGSNGRENRPLKSRCILVAEDDPDFRHNAVTALSQAGYRVLEANDGTAALRIAQQEAAQIDMVVTNVHMPGISGHELAREVKKLRSDVVVLIVSGENESDFPSEAIAHADALLKPVGPGILVQKVQELLGKSARRAV
jgi:two-component system cell cycle sensor histidine kinase/response regulator CckA